MMMTTFLMTISGCRRCCWWWWWWSSSSWTLCGGVLADNCTAIMVKHTRSMKNSRRVFKHDFFHYTKRVKVEPRDDLSGLISRARTNRDSTQVRVVTGACSWHSTTTTTTTTTITTITVSAIYLWGTLHCTIISRFYVCEKGKIKFSIVSRSILSH